MDVDGNDADSQEQVVKKLVRYALACEYQRLPIKRTSITEKGPHLWYCAIIMADLSSYVQTTDPL
jgi:hypothetical protein